MQSAMTTDFTNVTEIPGLGATAEQLERLYHRYGTAAENSVDKRVLEVACGAGMGLGVLAARARYLVGGDFTRNLVNMAHRHYKGATRLVQLDAHNLPFKDSSFDTIVFFEAVYYLQDVEAFLSECGRVLGERGEVIICTVNPEWSDFNASPHSVRYYSAADLRRLLEQSGFDAEVYGAFSTVVDSMTRKAVSYIRRAAVSMRLVPRSMKGKELLKRLFYGKLTSIPASIDEDTAGGSRALVPIPPDGSTRGYKILYALGSRRLDPAVAGQ